MNHKGFTLVQCVVTIAVIGVLSAISMPAYHAKIAKAQVSEAVSMMGHEKAVISTNLMTGKKCVDSGSTYTVNGKYGKLVVSGTADSVALDAPFSLLSTGCVLTYTFNATGASSKLKGKNLSAEIFNNGVLSKKATTTVSTSFIPTTLTTLTADARPVSATPVAGVVELARDSAPPSAEIMDTSVSFSLPVISTLRDPLYLLSDGKWSSPQTYYSLNINTNYNPYAPNKKVEIKLSGDYVKYMRVYEPGNPQFNWSNPSSLPKAQDSEFIGEYKDLENGSIYFYIRPEPAPKEMWHEMQITIYYDGVKMLENTLKSAEWWSSGT